MQTDEGYRVCSKVNKDSVRTPITYILPQISRILVGVEVNPAHDMKLVIPIFQDKISQFITRLHTCKLALMMILQGYQAF